MAIKPTESTEWATDASALKIAPSADQKQYGWSTSDNTVSGVPVKPNLQNQNAWQHNVHLWKEYFEAKTDDGLKWYEATTNTSLNVSSARAWFIKNQTAEIVFTIDGTDIKKGDLFKFKNDGPADIAKDDLHILHVKTTDANKNLVVWLMAGESCTIRSTKDNPTVTEDWQLVDIKRPNAITNAITVSNSLVSTSIINAESAYAITYIEKYGCFYLATNTGKILKTDQYGDNISVVQDFAPNVHIFVNIQYIESMDKIFVIGIDNSTNSPAIWVSTNGTSFSKVFDAGLASWQPYYELIHMKDLNRLTCVISSNTNARFMYSNDNGVTWVLGASATGGIFTGTFDPINNSFNYWGSVSGANALFTSSDGITLTSLNPATYPVGTYIKRQDGQNVDIPNPLMYQAFYNPYLKMHHFYFKQKYCWMLKRTFPQEYSLRDAYSFSYSYNGFNYVVDDTCTQYDGKVPNVKSYVMTPHGSIYCDEDGILFIAKEIKNHQITRLKSITGSSSSTDIIWSWAYNERMNRLLGFATNSSNVCMLIKSGRL